MKILSTLLLSTIGFNAFAQVTTPVTSMQESAVMLQKQATNSTLKNLKFKNIGPTIMSGRVIDVDVNPENPLEMLVAYASGGLWHTANNGNSFTPLMDNAPTLNLGDIAVDWKSRTIWAGTGENNSSRSSYAGIGVLKSTDFGKTWSAPMLPESQHIGRIILNPKNADHVVVAVTGPLYSVNDNHGIYMTKDGGKTWKKSLFATSKAGFIDLAYAPNNFNVQYSASWEKDRKAWNFDGSGVGTAIYKSTDGGENWIKVSTADSGFPVGAGAGRIGLAVYDENTAFAVHDSQFREEASKDNASAKANSKKSLVKDDFKTMSKEKFMALDNAQLNTYLKENNFQEKYRAENIKNMVSNGSVQVVDLAKYLEDANSLLFDTPVKGAELFKTTDGGKTWKKTHEGQIEDVFYSYGYYFAQVRVDPSDVNHLYIMGVPIIKSVDGGKNWTSISRENVHADHHALWINPNKRGHLVNGNDGGLNISYDDGATWSKHNSPAVGQFYYINYDLEKNYNVYGGLQDNGVWVAPNNSSEDRSWQQEGQYPWKSIMGGDGMQVQIDNRNSNVVYTGFQFGNYYRLDLENGKQVSIQPKHELGETPYRFNWQTPVLISSHNQDIIYYGGNKLHRSMNQGTDWTTISPDLTLGGKPGNVAYGTLATISESPLQFGLIYTGSDDGLVQVTKDGGASWNAIKGNWPADLWVSRVVASAHKKERVYVTLNGYRWDNFTSYVYKSDDYGQTWQSLNNGIAQSPVNVIIEHPKNEKMLFLGTDNAVYASTDLGVNWQLMNGDLPPVAIHDLKIQPVANDLLVGTHGRSIYKLNLDAMNLLKNDKSLSIAPIANVRGAARWGTRGFMWSEARAPKIPIIFNSQSAGKVNIEVLTKEGKKIYDTTQDVERGINIYNYDLTISESGMNVFKKGDKPVAAQNGVVYLPKGTYTIKIKDNSTTASQEFTIE